MITQPVSGTRRRSRDRHLVSVSVVVAGDGWPPARATTSAARSRAVRPADRDAQLAYSEWLLAKLTA